MEEVNKIITNSIESSKPSFYSLDEKNKVILDHFLFFDFLETSGFAKVINNGVVELVLVSSNLITKVVEAHIKDFVITYAKQNGHHELTSFLLRNKDLFTKASLVGLKTIEPDLLRDTENSAFLYFRNGIVEVTANKIKDPVPYDSVKKYIWKHHIKDFDYISKARAQDSVFSNFITKLCAKDTDRTMRLLSVIGYILHNYRTSANTKVVILNDEIISEMPEGGSGKTLLIQALGHVRNLVHDDGKSFNPKYQFAWSEIDESVDILLIDDISESFDFKDLFSITSNGFKVNRKNKDRVTISLEKSPVIVMTSNVIIKGKSSSFRRRQINVDIHQHFNAEHTPIDEYNHSFFTDWDASDWANYYALMVKCLQLYLKQGIIEIPEQDKKNKDAIRATNNSFPDWFHQYVIEDHNHMFGLREAISDYKSYIGSSGLSMSEKKMALYIKEYCEIFHWKYEKTNNGRLRQWCIEVC